MPKVSVDDHVSTVTVSPNSKLGEVLQEVIATLPPNRLVTKVLVDGKQIPHSEKAALLDAATDSVQEMAIRTVDKEIWAATGLDIALSCIERVQRSLIHAADLFRAEDRAAANHFFVHCVEGLERFFESLLISRIALKLDFQQILVDGIPLTQLEKNFSKILENIIIYQERQDFTAIADKVEYELLTNLSAWTAALRQLRLHQMSNA